MAKKKKISGLGGYRPGAGRKPRGYDYVRVTCELPKDLVVKIDDMALEAGVRRTQKLSEILYKALRMKSKMPKLTNVSTHLG